MLNIHRPVRRGSMNRTREEIVAQILNVCEEAASKTRVVYQANLNFRTVNSYLETLIRNRLIEVRPGKNVLYETTQKGANLLEALNRVNEEVN
jgi:predicted transcriptional regulator